MQYKEIVSVTGLSGLYQLLTTKSDGAIVRNIDDKSTKFISARQHSVTPIESIEVYTTGENVHLAEVFRKMMELEEQYPPVETKSAASSVIKGYFSSVFPDFDEDRVYVSDMKKMLKWYALLKKNDLLHFEMQSEDVDNTDTNKEIETEINKDETVIMDEPVSQDIPGDTVNEILQEDDNSASLAEA